MHETRPGDAGDWYVFYTRRDTQLDLRLQDAAPADCSDAIGRAVSYCGQGDEELENAQGIPVATSGSTTVTGGGPVAASIRRTLRTPGVYDVRIVDLGLAAMPYTLVADGSPAVTWPHPCVVPRVGRDEHLGTARYALAGGSCRVGRVRRIADPHVPRGDVVRFAPGWGAVRRRHARVEVVVSTG